ncbi:MAG: hypothetical protein WCJ25_04975 [Candidatus Moraniibacteriota bacterium]
MPKVRKKYLLSELPTGLSNGVPVRLGYVTVTEGAFRFREDGDRRFVALSHGTNATWREIEIAVDAYDLLILARNSVREEAIRYATSRDVGRTWVVDETTVPTEGTYLEAKIHEGKLVIADQEVRFKDTGGVRFLNRNPSKGSAPEEGDVAISEAVFEFLWEAARSKRIEKIRYEVPCDSGPNGGGLMWYVDRYLGPLADVVIAEVILKNSDVIGILPKKIAELTIQNVTRNSRYKYESLAISGVSGS